ncbi:uncharacterized protein LOC133530577 [Cydia pomonella]|uniref:uncharacterized protein LOC133530577 n=1 Tax=Cydia pomonella TaxID=82600 RepID=UPI002ADE647A|nr:uncharacterized protein LOC133530577 [Cydia pomonella]
MKDDCEKIPLAGLRKEEARPLTSVGGCPPYAGVGNNRLVGRLSAGLREHDLSISSMDSDPTTWKDSVDLEVEDCDPMSHSNTNDLGSDAVVCPTMSTLRLRGGGSPQRDSKGRFVKKSASQKPSEEADPMADTDSANKDSANQEEAASTSRLTHAEASRQPVVRLFRLSDSEMSVSSARTVASKESPRSKFWRKPEKRTAEEIEPSCSSESDTGALSESAISNHRGNFSKQTPKRGRGRPPTSDHRDGFGKFRSAISAEKAHERQIQAEMNLAASNASAEAAARERAERLMCRQQLPTGSQLGEQTLAAINQKVQDALSDILYVNNTSGHLKGTHQQKLKTSVVAIAEAFAEVRSRTATEEVARLEAANAQLSWQLEELRKQVDEMRSQSAAVAEVDIRRIMEEVSRSNREQFSNMLNARIEGLEGRLLPEPRLRPPLASDRIAAEAAESAHAVPMAVGPASQPTPSQPAWSSTAGTAQPSVSGKQKPKPKAKRGKRASLAAQEASEARQTPLAPVSEVSLTPAKPNWSAAVGRKGKKKTASGGANGSKATSAPKTTVQRKRKLNPPRAAAITLTLKPEAVEKGVKYETVLAEAKKRIKLEELGISAVLFRIAATGARMLQLPSDTKDAEKAADKLAEKLREVLGAEVHVQRPVKCAEIRIMGLDDSVSSEEVVAAVAADGGCPAEAIRSGVISRAPSGSGSLWLSCPVVAAKKITEAARIRVGWISARVVLLEAKPLRCYRCLEAGHVGAKCDREVDRSQLCYRCGKPGHKARDCTAEPSCVICSAAGKPSGHRIGAQGCQSGKARTAKSGGKKTGAGPVAPPPSQPIAVEEHMMDTAQ